MLWVDVVREGDEVAPRVEETDRREFFQREAALRNPARRLERVRPADRNRHSIAVELQRVRVDAAGVTTDEQAVRARVRVVGLDRLREPHGKRSAVRPRIQDRDGDGSGRTTERTPQPAGNAELLVAALVARAVV